MPLPAWSGVSLSSSRESRCSEEDAAPLSSDPSRGGGTGLEPRRLGTARSADTEVWKSVMAVPALSCGTGGFRREALAI